MIHTATVDCNREDLSRHLISWLLLGGLGPGLRVDDRCEDTGLVRLCAVPGCRGRSPDRVEIQLSVTDPKTTEVELRLWCGGMRAATLVRAALVGALVATALALALGWLINWSIPAGVLTAVLADQWSWYRTRVRLRSSFTALAHSVPFLPAPGQ